MLLVHTHLLGVSERSVSVHVDAHRGIQLVLVEDARFLRAELGEYLVDITLFGKLRAKLFFHLRPPLRVAHGRIVKLLEVHFRISAALPKAFARAGRRGREENFDARTLAGDGKDGIKISVLKIIRFI